MTKKISIVGVLLIIIGAIFFLKNFIDIPINIEWKYIWPIIVIALGVKMIFKDL